MKYLFLGMSVLLLSSCATVAPSNLNALSSGSVGCAPEQIQTYNYQLQKGSVPVYTWQAQCNGKTYYCSSRMGTGDNLGGLTSIACTPAQTQ